MMQRVALLDLLVRDSYLAPSAGGFRSCRAREGIPAGVGARRDSRASGFGPALWMLAFVLIGTIVAAAAGQRPASTNPGPPTSRPGDVVDEELVKKLLGGETTSTDAVQDMLGRMKDSSRRLTERHDTGGETQGVQARIVDGLDELIEQARRGGPRPRGKKGAKRRASRGRPEPGQDSQPKSADQRTPKSGSRAGAPGGASKGKDERRRSLLGEIARGWGFLPQRSRDEIAQGFDDEFLSKYYDQIVRYYRQLAKPGERE